METGRTSPRPAPWLEPRVRRWGRAHAVARARWSRESADGSSGLTQCCWPDASQNLHHYSLSFVTAKRCAIVPQRHMCEVWRSAQTHFRFDLLHGSCARFQVATGRQSQGTRAIPSRVPAAELSFSAGYASGLSFSGRRLRPVPQFQSPSDKKCGTPSIEDAF